MDDVHSFWCSFIKPLYADSGPRFGCRHHLRGHVGSKPDVERLPIVLKGETVVFIAVTGGIGRVQGTLNGDKLLDGPAAGTIGAIGSTWEAVGFCRDRQDRQVGDRLAVPAVWEQA